MPDVWDGIFMLLPVRELLVMMQSCKRIRAHVIRYWMTAFNVGRLLHPFIALGDIISFQDLLRRTGGIISGSTALQFLDRRSFDVSSDLDLYVPSYQSAVLKDWLLLHGLSETPTEDPALDGAREYPLSPEIDSVLNFTAATTSRRVQIISTKRDPAYTVLAFHSSKVSSFLHNRVCRLTEQIACVMNFISHDAVYSLYPVSTFSDRRSIVLGLLSPEERVAVSKYFQRGWFIQDLLGVDGMSDRPNELETRRRRVGDRLCWAFPLDLGLRARDWRSGYLDCSWLVTPSEVRVGSSTYGQVLFYFKMLLL